MSQYIYVHLRDILIAHINKQNLCLAAILLFSLPIFCVLSAVLPWSGNSGAQSSRDVKPPSDSGLHYPVHLQQRLLALWEQPALLLQPGLLWAEVEREAP